MLSFGVLGFGLFDEQIIILLESLWLNIMLLKREGINLEKAAELNSQFIKLALQLNLTDEQIEKIKSNAINTLDFDPFVIYVDGGARNNNDVNLPNESAIGFHISCNGKTLYEEGRYIGPEVKIPTGEIVPATNNTMEYYSIYSALSYLLKNKMSSKPVHIFSDSRMVTMQLLMTNVTKSPHLKALRDYIRNQLMHFPSYEINLIGREENTHADKLVNQAIDSHLVGVDK